VNATRPTIAATLADPVRAAASAADRLLPRARLIADDLGDALATGDALAVYAVADRLLILGTDAAAVAAAMRA
jgi:hypothetical protein